MSTPINSRTETEQTRRPVTIALAFWPQGTFADEKIRETVVSNCLVRFRTTIIIIIKKRYASMTLITSRWEGRGREELVGVEPDQDGIFLCVCVRRREREKEQNQGLQGVRLQRLRPAEGLSSLGCLIRGSDVRGPFRDLGEMTEALSKALCRSRLEATPTLSISARQMSPSSHRPLSCKAALRGRGQPSVLSELCRSECKQERAIQATPGLLHDPPCRAVPRVIRGLCVVALPAPTPSVLTLQSRPSITAGHSGVQRLHPAAVEARSELAG